MTTQVSDVAATPLRLHPDAGEFARAHAGLLGLSAALGVGLLWPGLVSLVGFWSTDADYSHGFLIPLVSAAILYRRREELARVPARASVLGASLALLSILAFLFGHFTLTPFLLRASVWGILVGSVWFLLGTELIRGARFPLLYLLFAIPLPQMVLRPLRLGLKSVATRASADVLALGGYAAHPEGNVLIVDSRAFEVADACSGIRSLVAILATAVFFAWIVRAGWIRGSALVCLAVPITVLVNIARIVLIAVAWSSWGIDLTSGLPHEVVGYAVFGGSLVLLWASWHLVDWLGRWRDIDGPEEKST